MADWNTCITSAFTRLVCSSMGKILPKSPALNQRNGYTSPAMYLRWPTVTSLKELIAPFAKEPLVGVSMKTLEPGAPTPSEVADGRPILIRYRSPGAAL